MRRPRSKRCLLRHRARHDRRETDHGLRRCPGLRRGGEIQAGDGEFWLHTESEPFEFSSPSNLGGAGGTMAIMLGDVDAHHRHAAEQGATIRYEPTDQDYGYREYGAVDLEGHLWSFVRPLT